MSKPIVLVDMDGVLADFTKQLLDELAQNMPEIEIPDELSLYRINDNFSHPKVHQTMHQIIASPGFFRRLDPIEGAIDGWQKLIDLGYYPRICSSPLKDNPGCENEKRSWLEYYIGEAAAEDAIIDSRKYLYSGFALIDDRIDHPNTTIADWQQIVFSQSYNRSYQTDFRLNGWHDPNLADLLQNCLHKTV